MLFQMSLNAQHRPFDSTGGVSALDRPEDIVKCLNLDQRKQVELRQFDKDLTSGNGPHAPVFLSPRDEDTSQKEFTRLTTHTTTRDVLEEEGKIVKDLGVV